MDSNIICGEHVDGGFHEKNYSLQLYPISYHPQYIKSVTHLTVALSNNPKIGSKLVVNHHRKLKIA